MTGHERAARSACTRTGQGGWRIASGQRDEEGQLRIARITVTPGVIDPANVMQTHTDALGHTMYHERRTAAGAAYPEYYHSTDGLRPETVVDFQWSQPASGGAVFQCYRDYVLGPGPDERWAWRDMDGTWRYPQSARSSSNMSRNHVTARPPHSARRRRRGSHEPRIMRSQQRPAKPSGAAPPSSVVERGGAVRQRLRVILERVLADLSSF